MPRIIHFDGNQPLIAANTMFLMHDQLADAEACRFLHKGIGGAFLFGGANNPLAKNILFGEQQVTWCFKALLDG